jgi:hypothetical protein
MRNKLERRHGQRNPHFITWRRERRQFSPGTASTSPSENRSNAASKPAPSPAARARHPEKLTHVSVVWKRRLPADHRRVQKIPQRLRRNQCPINAASSTGRCNTIQCIDSTMLPWENHRFGCAWSKASQGSVPAGLTSASHSGYCFQC